MSIINTIGTWRFLWVFFILVAIVAISIIAMILIVKFAKEKTQQRILMRITAVISIVTILLTGTLCGFYLIAGQHGLYTSDLTLNQLYNGVFNTPVDQSDEIPDNLAGCILIFYQFGCKDCDAIYNDLCAGIEGYDNIYWISAKSERGQALLELYPIESVPTGVYIQNENGMTTYIKKVLYDYDENGNAVLDTDNLDRLLYLQSLNR